MHPMIEPAWCALGVPARCAHLSGQCTERRPLTTSPHYAFRRAWSLEHLSSAYQGVFRSQSRITATWAVAGTLDTPHTHESRVYRVRVDARRRGGGTLPCTPTLPRSSRASTSSRSLRATHACPLSRIISNAAAVAWREAAVGPQRAASLSDVRAPLHPTAHRLVERCSSREATQLRPSPVLPQVAFASYAISSARPASPRGQPPLHDPPPSRSSGAHPQASSRGAAVSAPEAPR